MTASVDHLLYATPDLEAGVDEIERLTGVRPSYGGQHLGLGTHNALCSLGPRTYLEVIAPDPAQAGIEAPLPYGIGSLERPALRAWAAAPDDIDAAARAARAAGIDFGDVEEHGRRAPDGSDVRWRMATRRSQEPGLAIVPFLIDWGTTVHPATRAPAGLAFAELTIRSTHPAKVEAALEAIGAAVAVVGAERTELEAVLVGPSGERIVLHS